MTTKQRARARTVIAAGLGVGLALAACGGSSVKDKEEAAAERAARDSRGDTSDTTVAGGGAVTTTAPAAAPALQVIDLGLHAWHGEFSFEITKATLKTNATGLSARNLLLDFTVENLSNDPANLNRYDIALSTNGKAMLGVSRLPMVPGKSKADGGMTFLVDQTFDIAQATLTFGSPDSNQTIVPLSKGSAVQTIEPKTFPLTGAATAPDLKLVLKGASLTGDYVRGDKGKLYLRLDVEETNTGTGSGGYFLAATQFSLVVPGGTAVVANTDGNDDLSSEAVKSQATVTGEPVSFKVPMPGAGPYILRYKGRDDKVVEIPFTIP